MLERKPFTKKQKEEAYERQGGCCNNCGASLDVTGFEADHVDGDNSNNSTSNLALLCPDCNLAKGKKSDEHKAIQLQAITDLQSLISKGLNKEVSGALAERILDGINALLKVSYQVHRIPRGIEKFSKSAEELRNDADVELYKRVYMSAWKDGWLAREKMEVKE